MWIPLLALLSLAPQTGVSSPASPSASRGDPASPATEGHKRMVAALAEVARQAEIDDPFIGWGELPGLEKALAELPAGKQPQKRWELLSQIGMIQLHIGRNEEAVASFTEACALHPRLEGKVEASLLHRARFELAMSWLRLGETQNCVARHTSESCIVPIGKKGVHVEQQGSRAAMAIFTELIAEDPTDHASRWLLNLAAMTVGEYPDSVPKAYLIPPEVFASDEAFPRFVDVAPELGLNSMMLAGGVILDDFDGDEVLDVVVSSQHPGGQMEYFQGHKDGTFTKRTEEANLTGFTGGLNIEQTDYDNDGFADIFVLRGAWCHDHGRIPRSLLHNNHDGTFTDVAFEAGLATVNFPTQAGGWADYDNDGDLDLYVGNESDEKLDAPSQLFRNEGNGTFVDVASAAGVLNNRYAKGVSWGDYDGDRLPDLYVSNLGPNRLYHNKGDGTFEDVAERLGVLRPDRSFATWFWDFDDDGALDIYAATFLPRLGPYVVDLLGGKSNAEFACLYKGDGKGGFRDVASEVGLDEITVTMGANFGDVDNDGFLDFYLGTGFPEYEALVPNKMYWNRGGKKFSDVTTNGGFGHLQKGHAIAFADLDRDGDTDVFAHMGGAFPGDAFGNALFRNPGFGNHWVTVKVIGVRSNRAGIGARIRCDISENGVKRSVYRHVNSGGSFGANPLRQTLGLGKATKIDVLEVYWPTSDRTQTFRDVAVDQTLELREDRDDFRRLE